MKLSVNGTSLHVLERHALRDAQAPTLVFLHYFGGSSRAWMEVIEQLSNDYHCVAPDLRGFGDSAAPDSEDTLGEMADDVAALINALDLTRYVLVGHSMGGKIALALAAKKLSGLESLVLVSPSPPTPEPMSERERVRLLDSYGNKVAAEETAQKITARPFAASPLMNQIVEDNLRSSRAAWRGWLERGSREDISAQMSQVGIPTLVVVGEADSVLPPALHEREVVKRIAGARLVCVPGNVGHLLPLEAPRAIAELIGELH